MSKMLRFDVGFPSTPAQSAKQFAAALRQHHQIVLLTDGYSTPFLAKTAISMLRYRTADIVALLDSTTPAKTTDALLGVGGDLPVVGSLSEVGRQLQQSDAARLSPRTRWTRY